MGKVLHASDSGYFTSCVHDQEILAPSLYPAATSLEDAMKAFWRVRSWRVQGYITDEIIYPEYIKQNGDVFNPASEEELVCGRGFSININNSSGISSERITFSMFNYDLLGLGVGKNASGAYLPKMIFEAIYDDGVSSTEGYSDFDYGLLSGFFTLGGISGFEAIQLYRAPSTLVGGWIITPDQYWSYE